MKTYIVILLSLTFTIMLKAQVSIGKPTADTGALLDFETELNLGVALPKVINLDPSTSEGTLYFDTDDSKVKLKLAANQFLVLSEDGAGVPYDLGRNGYLNSYLIESSVLNGMIIGDEVSTATGVLVMESNDHAFVLPKMTDPVESIQSPEPGMIAYDTTKKVLCVFDGIHWSYWGDKGVSGINNQ